MNSWIDRIGVTVMCLIQIALLSRILSKKYEIPEDHLNAIINKGVKKLGSCEDAKYFCSLHPKEFKMGGPYEYGSFEVCRRFSKEMVMKEQK